MIAKFSSEAQMLSNRIPRVAHLEDGSKASEGLFALGLSDPPLPPASEERRPLDNYQLELLRRWRTY